MKHKEERLHWSEYKQQNGIGQKRSRSAIEEEPPVLPVTQLQQGQPSAPATAMETEACAPTTLPSQQQPQQQQHQQGGAAQALGQEAAVAEAPSHAPQQQEQQQPTTCARNIIEAD
jgi:hypothetical protein